MRTNKKNMGQLARWLSAQSGSHITFVEYDGLRLHFGVEERWTYKSTALDGTVTPAKKVKHGGYPKYFNMACYPCQIMDGDAVFLIQNNMTQEVHERFNKVRDRERA